MFPCRAKLNFASRSAVILKGLFKRDRFADLVALGKSPSMCGPLAENKARKKIITGIASWLSHRALWQALLVQPTAEKCEECCKNRQDKSDQSQGQPKEVTDFKNSTRLQRLEQRPSRPASGLEREGRLKRFDAFFLSKGPHLFKLGPTNKILPRIAACNSLRRVEISCILRVEIHLLEEAEDRPDDNGKKTIILHRYFPQGRSG